VPVPEIVLTAPADDANIDLVSAPNVTFTWNPAADVTAYKLLWSLSENLSNAQTINNATSPYVLTAANFDAALETAGIAEGAIAKVYWTVQQMSTSEQATPQKRSINVNRITKLIAPIAETAISLNYKEPAATAVTFSWANMSASAYELVISKNENLSNPLTLTGLTGITGTSKTITNADLQALITNGTLPKKYLDNKLYWNVKVSGNYISATPKTVYIYGYKQFVDTRGTEVQTYEVSVLSYNSKKVVWLAEDLRAENDINGTPLPVGLSKDGTVRNDKGVIGWAQPREGNFANGYSTGNTYPTAWKDNGNTGPYYDARYIPPKDITYLKSLIVPAGWKLPTWADFEELYTAANALGGNLQVLRNPACYPSEETRERWNEWKMNMCDNGRFQYAFDTFTGLFARNGGNPLWFYTYDTSQKGGNAYDWACNLSMEWGFNIYDNGDSCGTVRLIYTGDN
jgi:hypothetical protein